MKNKTPKKSKNQNNKPKPRRHSTPKAELLRAAAEEFPDEIFSPEEAFRILFGRCETVRRIFNSVRDRLRLTEGGTWASLPPAQLPCNDPPPPRPVHSLSRLNRSRVYPPLVSEQIESEEASVTKIVERIGRAALALGQTPCRQLDQLATASQMPIECCAELLVTCGIVKELFDADEIRATRDARSFWILYAEGRAVRGAKIAEKNLPRWHGDFAFFNRAGLEALLPGITLPDHFQRLEFLTNYVIQANGACLDLYKAAGRPLVRHPFVRD
jgi:hypothetical protein